MTDYIITELPYSDSFLKHYGIHGQKWGVRRFQYEDRTWTPEGKIRYGRGGGERRSNDSEGVKGVKDSAKAAINRISSKIDRKISGSDDHQITRKKAKDMSDEELRTAMARLNAEKTYRDLYDAVHRNDTTPSKIVKSVLRPVANVANYAGDRFTKGAIDKLIDMTLNKDAYEAAKEMREINLQNARLNRERLEDELARARVLAAQRLTREEAAKLKEEEQQTAEIQRKLDRALLERKLQEAEDIAKINDETERQARIDSTKALNEARRDLDKVLLENQKRDAQYYNDSRDDEARRAELQREADKWSKQFSIESDKLRIDFADRMAKYARMPETTPEDQEKKRQAYIAIKSYGEAINDFISAGKGSLKIRKVSNDASDKD